MEDKLIVAALTEHESIDDALIACVKACGGSKAVGVALWPSQGVEAAQRKLLACLNPDRAEKLSPLEAMHIMRMARDKGCHAGMEYIAATLSYSMPHPVEPEDEKARLQREYIEATKTLAKIAARIEQTDRPTLRSAA